MSIFLLLKKLQQLFPTKAKWLAYLPAVITDQILRFLRRERRWWVIVLLFVFGFTTVFRSELASLMVKDPIPTQVATSEKINDLLQGALEGSGADRAYIFQFHNGIQFYSGQHAQRMSCTYEVVAYGTSREAPNLQNLQTSLFSWWINETLQGRMHYEEISKMEDYTTKIVLEQQGIQSIVCHPLISKGRVIGIVGLDFVRMQTSLPNDTNFRNSFAQTAHRVSALLEEDL